MDRWSHFGFTKTRSFRPKLSIDRATAPTLRSKKGLTRITRTAQLFCKPPGSCACRFGSRSCKSARRFKAYIAGSNHASASIDLQPQKRRKRLCKIQGTGEKRRVPPLFSWESGSSAPPCRPAALAPRLHRTKNCRGVERPPGIPIPTVCHMRAAPSSCRSALLLSGPLAQ